MEAKKILTAAVFLLVGLALGFGIGQLTNRPADEEKTDQTEVQRLKEIIEEFLPVEPEMFSINGRVLEVKADSLLIETPQFHPLEELPTEREVLVSGNTLIVQRTEKDPEVHEKEIEEYMKLEEELIESGAEPEAWPTAPEPYSETKINLEQIEGGSRIQIEAGQDIKWTESFTASKIAVEF